MISEYFFTLYKFRFNFEHFKKIYDPDRCCIFDITYSKKCGWRNV